MEKAVTKALNEGRIVDYIKHHMPIIIQYEDGSWCNANISLENGTLVVKPDYKMPFDD